MLVVGLVSSGVVVSARAAEPASDPLLELNQEFRAAYARGRKQILAKSGPVIVVEGDNVVLLRDDRRTEVRAVPELYHTLKAVSHVPLAIYVLLAPYGDGELNAARLADLRAYRDKVATADRALENRGLSAESLERQRLLLADSVRFLDGVLANKKASTTEVAAWTRKVGPLLLATAAEAAQAQLDGLHRQVMTWKKEMSVDDWNRLRVVVMGSAMPRKGNLNVRYFARLLEQPGEGSRIVYAEALFDEQRALNLLGTTLLDTDVGRDFFGDPTRMHRDLLDDAAADYVKKMTFDK
jgi:hypothetical protein